MFNRLSSIINRKLYNFHSPCLLRPIIFSLFLTLISMFYHSSSFIRPQSTVLNHKLKILNRKLNDSHSSRRQRPIIFSQFSIQISTFYNLISLKYTVPAHIYYFVNQLKIPFSHSSLVHCSSFFVCYPSPFLINPRSLPLQRPIILVALTN